MRADSPSKTVGAAPVAGFGKVRHAHPMLSIQDAFDDDEARDFAVRVRRFLGLAEDAPLDLMAEPKIDGLAINLRYEKGKFVQGATRGDGVEGEDVTANLLTLKELPKTLKGDAPDSLEVRGEVYITRADFTTMNEDLAQSGERDPFANPRNARLAVCVSSMRPSPRVGRCACSATPSAKPARRWPRRITSFWRS